MASDDARANESVDLLVDLLVSRAGLDRDMAERCMSDIRVALADLTRLRTAVETIRVWAFTVHGGVKAPADVWPGLRAALEPVTA
jgi:formyltetrahydrofolate synthetase